MTRFALYILFAFAITSPLHARILPIGAGGYSGLEAAAAAAQPGDTIMFLAGTHAGGAHVSNLQGTSQAWITIMGDPAGVTLIEDGGNAFQLSDPAYLRIAGLEFDGQTANGVNIDDGGSFDTPAHDILIEHCTWRGIDATGNNDMLKMSGVDNFTVRHCSFRNGSPGGSMIDMVGCHFGNFEDNRFENAGSNCIQAKGGTQRIRITRNLFLGGGQRAINIGGSTGLPYFRPQDADYEAKEISIWANIFTGAIAPVGYVGAVRCEVFNNTIYLPEKWAVRILQETTDARFLLCGENTFVNNLVVLDNRAASPTFIIGPNTRPETFVLMNNLWYNTEDPGWSGPNAPVTDHHVILGRDPLLSAPALRDGNFLPRAGSPAIAAGTGHTGQLLDFYGRSFRATPTIGAIEADTITQGLTAATLPAAPRLSLFPHPVHSTTRLSISGADASVLHVHVYDVQGRRLPALNRSVQPHDGMAEAELTLSGFAPGWYFIVVNAEGGRPSLRPLLLLPSDR
jgi:hypothetical protein